MSGYLRLADMLERAASAIRELHARILELERCIPGVDMSAPVISLGLSVRSSKAMEGAEIKTIFDLCNKTPNELLLIKNFGVSSLTEIRERLREKHLSLKDDKIE